MDEEQTRQFIPIKEAEFVEAYLDETSPAFLSPTKAAREVSITPQKANTILQRKEQWFKELKEEHPMLAKAEENLAAFLDLPPDDPDHADRVLKASMFVAERLGKHKYSTRQEITDTDGKPLIPREEVEMRLINIKRKQLEE